MYLLINKLSISHWTDRKPYLTREEKRVVSISEYPKLFILRLHYQAVSGYQLPIVMIKQGLVPGQVVWNVWPSYGAEACPDHGPSTFKGVWASREQGTHAWLTGLGHHIQSPLEIWTCFYIQLRFLYILVTRVFYYMRKLFSKFMHPDESRDRLVQR